MWWWEKECGRRRRGEELEKNQNQRGTHQRVQRGVREECELASGGTSGGSGQVGLSFFNFPKSLQIATVPSLGLVYTVLLYRYWYQVWYLLVVTTTIPFSM